MVFFISKLMPGNLKELEKMVGVKVNSYKITRYINSGGYGDVFEVINTKGKRFAMKIPNNNTNSENSIITEFKIYRILSNRDNGIINAKISKSVFLNKSFMVMDLLGLSISKYLKIYKTFNLKTTLLLTIQMLKILKYIHSKGFIHRDVKAGNFSVDQTNTDKIFCIDFGMSSRYIDNDGNHLVQEASKSFYGTELYASHTSHLYKTQSRRDDLESMLYSIVCMFKGSLPWSEVDETDKKKSIQKIGKMKMNIKPEDLIQGMPREYVILCKYIRNLDYYDKPHYTTLVRMFENLYTHSGFEGNTLQWSK